MGGSERLSTLKPVILSEAKDLLLTLFWPLKESTAGSSMSLAQKERQTSLRIIL
jgi:hypothetical protein